MNLWRLSSVSMPPHSDSQAAAQLPNHLLDTTGFYCFHLPGCQVASLSLPTQLPVLLASLCVISPASHLRRSCHRQTGLRLAKAPHSLGMIDKGLAQEGTKQLCSMALALPLYLYIVSHFVSVVAWRCGWGGWSCGLPHWWAPVPPLPPESEGER